MPTILHLERSAFLRKVVREIVRTKGYDLIESESAEESFAVLKEKRVDLIVTGIELASGTAEDFITELNQTRFTHIPVIIITGNDSLEIRGKYFSLGVSDYILKQDLAKGVLSRFLENFSREDHVFEHLRTLNIGVLDDSKITLKVVQRIFEMNGIRNVDYFTGPEQLFQSRKPYDLLLVDIILPRFSGSEIIVKYRERCENCVIICISAVDNTKTISHILHSGADDYLIKPFDAELFMARIRSNVRTYLLVQELEDKKRILEKMAVTDGLTDTFNHEHIIEILADEIDKSIARRHPVSIVLMDIDFFKGVNDSFGHRTGDLVLSRVARTMKNSTRRKDFIGRYGGEEFLIILPGTSLKDAITVAEHIRTNIENLSDSERDLRITISGGVAQHGGEGPEELIERADRNLYTAKEEGRNRIVS